jgi:peptidoglycan/xylan/chitin deacetylase (PgdA/CDA1 family)
MFLQPGMFVKPETFEMQMKTLLSETTVLPLNEVLNSVGRSAGKTSSKPLCAVTFDDGWKDFYDNAFPILKSMNVPATVYLPTNFIGTNQWFWTDRLAYIWKQRTRLTFKGSNPILQELSRITGSFASQIEKALAVLKKQPLDTIELLLNELATACGVSSSMPGRAFLNWHEVKEMHDSGLITFGSHTADHHILTTIDDHEIENQLLLSKQKLIAEHAAPAQSVSFCYPNGNYSDGIERIVKNSGYSLAVTTKTGWNTLSQDPFALNRIGIHQDIASTTPMFLSRIAGLFSPK